jgi:CIC family chloride channel protein
MTQELRPLTQDMQLGQALQRFMEHHGERLPVIRSVPDPVLLGAADKSTLLATYVRLAQTW